MKDFQSFFMGGFECADLINRSGERVSLLQETAHHKRVRQDYELLRNAGISTVREGICWSEVEKKPYIYDFSEVKNRIEVADQLGMQQIWDLCHFGYPDGLIPTHPCFIKRFTSLCIAFANFYRESTSRILWVVPINEISFLSWHSGDVRGTVPFAVNSGFDIKYHLCKAAIQGIEALLSADSTCRILTVEPLIRIHSNPNEADSEHVFELNENQYQAMDIIAGRMCPELGGKPEYLDIIGVNYYYNNQWVHRGPILSWESEHHKFIRLSALLHEVYNRYHRPILLTETGHFGLLRDVWLEQVTDECISAIQMGVDLKGICIYPVIDRPDWDDLNYYCKCGIWDLDAQKERIADESCIRMLDKCIRKVEQFAETVFPMGATVKQQAHRLYS